MLRNQLTLIMLGAFLIRGLLLLIYRPWDPAVQRVITIDDASTYHELAVCILDHFSFCGHTFRTPGYPFFVAVVYSIFGIKPWMVLLVQIFIDLLTIYVVFKLGELIFSKRAGVVAAAFLAIDPTHIFSATSLLSDGLFVLFMLTSLLFYIQGLQKQQFKWFIISGICLAFSALTRPVAQYYLLIMVVFALFWPSPSKGRKAVYSTILAVSFGLTISPWLYRNYSLYDNVRLSTTQGENLLFWQVVYARAGETGKPPSEVTRQFEAEAKALGYSENKNPFSNEAIAQRVGLDYIASNPYGYTSRMLQGMVHVYTNLGTAEISRKLGLTSTVLPPEAMFSASSESKLISTFFRSKSKSEILVGLSIACLLLLNYSLFVLGVYELIKRKRNLDAALFVVTIAYFTITAGVIGMARFRLPIAPFYMLIGAFYVDSWMTRSRSSGVRNPAPGSRTVRQRNAVPDNHC